MAILITGKTYVNNDQVSALNLNQAVNNATFASGAVDGSTTQLSGGAIIVRDGGVTPAKLSAGGPSWTGGGTLSATAFSGPLTGNVTGNVTGTAANVTGTVAVANGGTGATTDSGARTNLGLGTIATQAANSVAITGGSISGITDLAVADGGTGASDAGGARTNLGATTVGGNLFTLSNPSAVRFLRVNADNTITSLSDNDMRIALKAGGVILSGTTTTQSPATTAESDLITHTLAANTLGVDGQRLRWNTAFTTGANAANKNVRLYIGSTKIYDSGALALNNITVILEAIIVRLGATSQKVYIKASSNFSSYLVQFSAHYITSAENLGTSLTLKATGQTDGGTLGDVTQLESVVEHLPQP